MAGVLNEDFSAKIVPLFEFPQVLLPSPQIPSASSMASKGKENSRHHFVEFLLTKPAQRLWSLRPVHPADPCQRALRRMPVRQDI